MQKFNLGQEVWTSEGIGADLKVINLKVFRVILRTNPSVKDSYFVAPLGKEEYGEWNCESILFSSEKEAIDWVVSRADDTNKSMLTTINDLKDHLNAAKKRFKQQQSSLKKLIKRRAKL